MSKKAKATNHTKSIRKKYWGLKVLNFTLLTFPLIFYIGRALTDDAVLVYNKIALVGSVMVALILTTFNILAKLKLRAPIWIILLGLYLAMKAYLMPLVIILAVVSILDDFFFSPVLSKLKVKLIANIAMDEREV